MRVSADGAGELGAGADSQRERAKRDRRRRIVQAAHDLLREVGLEAVSGKLIAARAGVSLSTVYNLFGSKDAVLVALFDQDLAQYEARLRALPPQPALDRLFQAVDVAADLYRDDPAFYRAILWRRPTADETAVVDAMRRPRNRFWRAMVEAALDQGQLRDGTDAAVVSRLLIRQFSAALADWIAGEAPLEQFRIEVKLGFAAVLLPFAACAASPALNARLQALHDAAARARGAEELTA